MNKIVCIIVTYNRLELLKKCVRAVREQTYKNFDILVINNGSTDNTLNWLNTQEDLIVLSQSNLGGSGGFHNGLKKAYELGYDYYWIMDDDGIPDSKCLESLYNVAQKGFHYVASLLYTFEGVCHHPKVLNNDENIVDHGGGPFNSILLSRILIKNIGLPNYYYFIWGDEFEFLNRVHESYFHTALAKSAIHYHKIPETKKGIEKRIFYKIRNMIWSARLSKGITRGKMNK